MKNFWDILSESLNMLFEAKSAAEIAHDLGLTHIGYGYWADETGKTVARTIDGQLVKIDDDPNIGEPDYSQQDDPEFTNLHHLGEVALDKLTAMALEHMGMAEYIDAENNARRTLTRDGLKKMLLSGEAPDWNAAYMYGLEKEQKEAFEEFVEFLLNSKGSALIKQALIAHKQVAGKETGASTYKAQQIGKIPIDPAYKNAVTGAVKSMPLEYLKMIPAHALPAFAKTMEIAIKLCPHNP
jgi:hypothetical protein